MDNAKLQEVKRNPIPPTQDDPTDRKTVWEEDGCTVYRTSARTGPGCHDNCGVLLHVKDGKLEKIEGDPENPFNQGRLCPRCLALKEMMYHEDRLKYPMIRKKEDRGKNKFERVTWDEAYDLIERELKRIIAEYGNEAIYAVQGTGRDMNGYTPLLSLYLGTPNTGTGFLSGIACYAPRIIGTSLKAGDLYIADYSQFSYERYADPRWKVPGCILVWGNNPVIANSDGSLGHWVVECMKRGSELITIDPKLTWLAGKSKLWLPVRPGTDAALCLALCHQIIKDGLQDDEFVAKWTYGFDDFKACVEEYSPERVSEICRIDEDLIIDAARMIGNASSTALQWGVAFDHTAEGFFAGIAAFDLLALTGNFEKPGSNVCARPVWGVMPTWMGAKTFWDEVSDPRPHPEKVINGGYPALSAMSSCSPDGVLEAMETGEPYQIKAVWMQTNNPISCMGAEPQRILPALQKMEFNVVVDLFMTPTALACADVLLPAAMFPERIGVSGHEPYFLQAIVDAVDPYYEAKSDQRIIYEIGERFGGKDHNYWEDEEGFYDYVLKSAGFTYQELKERAWAWPEFEYNKHEKGLLRPDGQPGFPTSTGRYNFWSPELDRMGMPPVGGFAEPPESPVSTPDLAKDYPLILTTGARKWGFFHSEHRQSPSMRRMHPDPGVDVHPKTAEKYGLKEGDWCYVENRLGKARMKVRTSDVIREDTVSADHAWWFPERDPDDGTLFGTLESNINTLIPMKPGRIGLGANYKSQLCTLRKCEEE